jgi:long-chain acyl-CoA synthetase
VILAGLRHFSEEIHFYSGGTVGTQRIVPHSAETLLEEIDELAGLFADRRRVIVTVPVHHIYGFLFGVLLPRALRVPVVDAQYRLLSREAQPVPGDLIVSIPFLWERYLPRVGSWGTDVVGSSSTAPLSADLGSELCRAGLSRLVEVYGSSETAGVGWRDHCAPRTGGASHSAPVRRSGTAVGEVETIGFALFERWTRGTDDVLRGTAGTVALPDRLEWRDDRHFLPRGRRDAVVQVGGNNVDLDALRLRILEVVPEAEDCALRLREDRLRLFVAVPAEQGDGPDSSPSPDAAPRDSFFCDHCRRDRPALAGNPPRLRGAAGGDGGFDHPENTDGEDRRLVERYTPCRAPRGLRRRTGTNGVVAGPLPTGRTGRRRRSRLFLRHGSGLCTSP